MQKIPTIFVRDPKPKCTPVTEEHNPDCDWVFRGEGIATRKIDGINIKIEGALPYIRIKPSTRDYTVAGYEPYKTGMNKHVDKALDNAAINMPHDSDVTFSYWPDGIYEVYGNGIRGNPEKIEGHHMVRIAYLDRPGGFDHALTIQGVPRSYRGLMGYMATHDIEGIVFHHRDGRMGKIKAKDFYHLSRP